MSLPVDCFFSLSLSLFFFPFSLSFILFLFFFLLHSSDSSVPRFFYREFSTGWDESKNEKETFGLVFLLFFFDKVYSEA